MQCFSLTTKPKLLPNGMPVRCGGRCRKGKCSQFYPKPIRGIPLSLDHNCVVIGWTQHIPLSDALLTKTNVQQAGQHPRLVRASIERSSSGAIRFTPEREDDTLGALLYLDIGVGRALRMHYEQADMLARVCVTDRFGGYDEKALVRLGSNQTITAVRSAKSMWPWSKAHPCENLHITFDGHSVTVTVESV